jgi:Fe-S-cluster containining protein
MQDSGYKLQRHMGTTNKNSPVAATQLAGSSNQKQIQACLRCGVCCTKGGPGFHDADKELIEKGIIPSRCLYTLRKGELAYDNVRGCLAPVGSDIIKLKGQNDSWTCIFFNEDQKACGIYDNRPLECETLQCWDARQLESMYDTNRLTREDLVSEIEGLWELICDHQNRCDYGKIQKLVKALNGPDREGAQKGLIEIIQYDMEIRKLVVSEGGLDVGMLDFLFGRPLIKTIGCYGLRVDSNLKKIRLVPSSARQTPKLCDDEKKAH